MLSCQRGLKSIFTYFSHRHTPTVTYCTLDHSPGQASQLISDVSPAEAAPDVPSAAEVAPRLASRLHICLNMSNECFMLSPNWFLDVFGIFLVFLGSYLITFQAASATDQKEKAEPDPSKAFGWETCFATIIVFMHAPMCFSMIFYVYKYKEMVRRRF